jgi:hypothetical protein
MSQYVKNTNISDPVGEKKPDKSYAWWVENIDHKITPQVSHHIVAWTAQSQYSYFHQQVRHTLETYSQIRPEDVSKHVYAIVRSLLLFSSFY